jgi:hypothetical protein
MTRTQILAGRTHERTDLPSLRTFLDAGIDHAEIEVGVDERAEERRVETMEGDFRIGDLVSYYSAFSGVEVPCTVI